MQTFNVKLLICKILKTKNCVPFEVQYYSNIFQNYFKVNLNQVMRYPTNLRLRFVLQTEGWKKSESKKN